MGDRFLLDRAYTYLSAKTLPIEYIILTLSRLKPQRFLDLPVHLPQRSCPLNARDGSVLKLFAPFIEASLGMPYPTVEN